jgi:CRISPR-associated endonuclease Cas2
MKKLGPVQQKILLMFLGGVALGCSGSPTQYYSTLRKIRKEWRGIDQRSFNRSVRSLHTQKLLQEIRRADGSITLRLTQDGRMRAGFVQLFGGAIRIKRQKVWDGLWRIVIFDVPEKKRVFRNILRNHLKTIGFEELQHSVFIFPYPCEKEIKSLVELYSATQYVRIITAKAIDNEKEIQRHFFTKNKK